MSELSRHYEGWAGSRTGYNARLRYFVTEGVISTLRSKWSLAILLITYGIVVMPRVIEALMLETAVMPQFYASLYNDLQLLLLLFAAVAGAGIIADDLRDGSIVLLVTRRLGATGYLLRRMAALAITLSALTVLPFVIVLSIALLSTSGAGLADGARTIFAGLAVGMMLSGFFTIVVAALSAVLKDRRYAGAGIFFMVLFSDIAASIMEGLSSNAYSRLISVGDNIGMVSAWLFDLPAPYDFSAGYSAAILFGIIALGSVLLARGMLSGEVA